MLFSLLLCYYVGERRRKTHRDDLKRLHDLRWMNNITKRRWLFHLELWPLLILVILRIKLKLTSVPSATHCLQKKRVLVFCQSACKKPAGFLIRWCEKPAAFTDCSLPPNKQLKLTRERFHYTTTLLLRTRLTRQKQPYSWDSFTDIPRLSMAGVVST